MSSPATQYHPVKAPQDAVAEVNHRVANNLAMVAGLVQLHARGIAGEDGSMERAEVCTLLEEIAHRINAVGRLHRLLSSLDCGSRVDVAVYLREISETVMSTLSDGNSQLVYADDANCLIAAERALPLGLIVSELVTNAVKYAHPSGVAGTVTIGCRRVGDGIRLQIADDGVGLPEGFDPAHANSLGMRLARALSAQIGATLAFTDTGTGLTVEIALPA